VPADISCLVIQAIGGGIAASAGGDNLTLLQHGNRVIMAGVVLQVVVLLVFGSLAGDYLFRAGRAFRSGAVAAEHEAGAALFVDKKFRTFLWAMGVAYSGLLIRCIYRIAEMAGTFQICRLPLSRPSRELWCLPETCFPLEWLPIHFDEETIADIAEQEAGATASPFLLSTPFLRRLQRMVSFREGRCL
jgi:hypothetical protein